ncbi:MAG: hypothetical protein QM751_03690 [Paludibacteraceae bacterium]
MARNQLLRTFFLFVALSAKSHYFYAAEPSVSYKMYGFIRNDFYYNSRQNMEALDGLFNIFPKPKENGTAGKDNNATSNAEMLSVASRLGIDFTSLPLFGAKTSAKIECDFAGFSTNYYVIRLRQAYTKLNWEHTELLIGQTWHPLFGTVFPTVSSLNTGAPFQPFNRSPQLKVKQSLLENFSLTAAATYQMQYMSQGPNGASVNYLKNAILPNLFISLENKSGNITSGLGLDTKTIKVSHQRHTSFAALAYGQYVDKKWQVKAKALYGQNLSDHLMIGGYGITGVDTKYSESTYTNFNTFSSWVNVVYGSKLQVGIFGGLSQNLGTEDKLLSDVSGKFTVYGYGVSIANQELLDRIYRVSPHISYNAGNIKLGLEYELTAGNYGTIREDGRINNSYEVTNHRLLATISYNF